MNFEAMRSELRQYYLQDLTPCADAFCAACERELDALWRPEMTPAEMKRLQYRCITELGHRLKGLHISDNFGDGPHHHTWPFAGIINFDSVMQGLVDVGYAGPFTFEASYTLLHQRNLPYHRQPFQYGDQTVTKLLSPSIGLKQQAMDLLYETGKYILEAYGLYEA
jgi:hypothetical protein